MSPIAGAYPSGLWAQAVVCLVPESSPPLHSASVQSITDTTGLLGSRAHLSRGLSCTTHTRPLSPRPRTGKLITEDGAGLSEWLRCGGAAWPCSLSQSLWRFKQTQPSHPHTLGQKSTGSSRAWRSPFLSFVSFPQSLALSMSKCQPISPADLPSCTPHLGDPCAPRSSEQVSWITVRTAALKIARPPGSSLSPHARPRMSGTLILQPVSTSWLLLPHDHDPKPHPKAVFLDQRVRDEERKQCKLCEHQLGTTYRSMSVG